MQGGPSGLRQDQLKLASHKEDHEGGSGHGICSRMIANFEPYSHIFQSQNPGASEHFSEVHNS